MISCIYPPTAPAVRLAVSVSGGVLTLMNHDMNIATYSAFTLGTKTSQTSCVTCHCTVLTYLFTADSALNLCTAGLIVDPLSK